MRWAALERLYPELGPPRLNPRVREDVVYQCQEVPLTGPHATQRVELGRGDGAVNPHLQQLHITADGIQRSAQFMAHRRQKFRFGQVRGLGGAL